MSQLRKQLGELEAQNADKSLALRQEQQAAAALGTKVKGLQQLVAQEISSRIYC